MDTSYITKIGTANPAHKIDQRDVLRFMQNNLGLNERETRKLNIIYGASAIDYRYSVIKDYGTEKNDFDFFPSGEALEPFPTIEQRMGLFEKFALDLSAEAVNNCITQDQIPNITHLITVSCTGMYAPGLDIQLVEKLNLNTDVERTCINFMGCYAAFNALKLADKICRLEKKAKVLIVDIELCTLHFQKKHMDDHYIANAIFGDGAAAVLVEPKPNEADCSIGLNYFFSDLILEGKTDMAWYIRDFGFEMKLSTYVPKLLKSDLRPAINKLFERAEIESQEITQYAVHPGGKRILEAVAASFEIDKSELHNSYEVLKDYGNMSSVTILFVLKRLMEQLTVANHGESILAIGLGPGITLESGIFSVHHV